MSGQPAADVVPAARGRRRLTVLLLAGLLGCPLGCERSAAPGSPPAVPGPQRSPRATIEELIALRRSGAYQSLGELVLPGRAHEITTTLLAVDEFLHANRALCNFVRDNVTPGLAQAIDQGHWSDHLGVFSRYVELVDERIEDGRAVVSFTVDGRLPLRHAELRLVNGQWRYDPGPGYDPQLPAAFKRMARGLRLVLEDLKSGKLPVETVQAEPERLLEEVRLRLLPGVKMLPFRPEGD